MLDKQLAKRLSLLTSNKEAWEGLKEHLQNLRHLELRVLVGATSEQEMYRSQGKINSLELLERLKDEVEEAKGRNSEV
jgi:hypothetical protein